ncbi:MAG: hypothetical protein Q6L68_14965, partial [Thermostichus sp. DG02_5_bins_236]
SANVDLSSQLLISTPAYQAVKEQLSQVQAHPVKPSPNAKPIRVYAVHPRQASLLPHEDLATGSPLATTQPTGWLETLREWLRAWSRF